MSDTPEISDRAHRRKKPGPKPLDRPSKRVAVRLRAVELDYLATVSDCISTAIHTVLRRARRQAKIDESW